MRNRRSSFESINAGRQRRSAMALDELDSTLDRLEGQLGRTAYEDGYARHSRSHDLARLHDMAHLHDMERSALHERPSAVFSEPSYPDIADEFSRLSSMIQRFSAHNNDLQAREQSARSFDRRWGEFERRFDKFAGDLTTSRMATPDPALKRLAARIEEIGGMVNALPTSGVMRSLEDKMKLLQGAVDRFSHHQELPGAGVLATIEERLDELTRAVAVSLSSPRTAPIDPKPFERLEARITALARQIGETSTNEDATRHLSDQLASLSYRVEDLAHRIDLPEQAIERLAGQIGSIAERFDHAPALANLDTVFHGLETRIASMADLLEQRHEDALAHGKALFHGLETRINDVAARIETEQPAASHDQDHFIAAMDARFAELASHFERQITATPREDDGALRDLEDRLERRLDTISSHIETSSRDAAVDTNLIRSLEAQIAGLAEHITRPTPASHQDKELGPRLERIEQSISGSHSDVLEAARFAAEEAVRNFSGSAAEGEVVAALANDLKSLEALTRHSDDRNTRTFEAIHDTLLKIVDRLSSIESEKTAPVAALAPTLAPAPMPAAAPMREVVLETKDTPSLTPDDEVLTPTVSAAEPADEKPAAKRRSSLLGGLTRRLSRSSKISTKDDQATDKSLPALALAGDEAPSVEHDQTFANEPLEPGSGTPDLNAIMRRVRDERSQPARGINLDASKADFIAAARRAAQAAAKEAETASGRKVSGADKDATGTASFFKKSRTPLLMGVTAILIALVALQGSRSFLGGDSAPQQIASPAVPPTTDEQTIEAIIEAPASSVRMADENETAFPAGDDWLDMDSSVTASEIVQPEEITTASTAQPVTALDNTIVETDVLPEPSEQALAAIPLDAGPVALREAAAAGDSKALFEIGNRYAEGRGVAEDMTVAVQWYEKAAEQNLAPAQYRLASFYEKGIGVAKDVVKARRFYEQAASQGNASAMHNLAVLNAMGADGKSDNIAAARWFQRAAELGVRDSQFNLGILAAKGVGMEQNLQEAYKWFALVAKAGDKDAADKRDEIAKALRPEQLETARAATELWRVKELNAQANTVEIPESWGESQSTTASIDMRAAVRNIQQILNAQGFNAGSEDGMMGQKTKTAIAAFQKANGMAATGEVDEALVRALLEKR